MDSYRSRVEQGMAILKLAPVSSVSAANSEHGQGFEQALRQQLAPRPTNTPTATAQNTASPSGSHQSASDRPITQPSTPILTSREQAQTKSPQTEHTSPAPSANVDTSKANEASEDNSDNTTTTAEAQETANVSPSKQAVKKTKLAAHEGAASEHPPQADWMPAMLAYRLGQTTSPDDTAAKAHSVEASSLNGLAALTAAVDSAAASLSVNSDASSASLRGQPSMPGLSVRADALSQPDDTMAPGQGFTLPATGVDSAADLSAHRFATLAAQMGAAQTRSVPGAREALQSPTDLTLKDLANLDASQTDPGLNVLNSASQASLFTPQPWMAVDTASIMMTQITTPFVAQDRWQAAIHQHVMTMAGAGDEVASLTLSPPDLGPIQVVLKVDNQSVDTSFVTDNPLVRQALEDGMQHLRERMQSQGMQLGQTFIGDGQQAQQHFNRQFNQQAAAIDTRTSASHSTQQPDDGAAAVTSVRRSALGHVDTFV